MLFRSSIHNSLSRCSQHLLAHVLVVLGISVLINVEVRNLLSAFAHDNLVDISDCAPVDLLLVWNVTCVPGKVVFLEGRPEREQTTSWLL